MNTVKMIADAKLRQDGEWINPGKPFTCSEADADDLKAMGMAHRQSVADVVETAVDRVKRTYRTRNMTAQ